MVVFSKKNNGNVNFILSMELFYSSKLMKGRSDNTEFLKRKIVFCLDKAENPRHSFVNNLLTYGGSEIPQNRY